jgi:hypothetical protein
MDGYEGYESQGQYEAAITATVGSIIMKKLLTVVGILLPLVVGVLPVAAIT